MITPDPAVRVALRWPARCGEGPVWDARGGTVHWVDITAGQVHSTSWPSGPTRTVGFDQLIGAAAPLSADDPGFLLATETGFARCGTDGVLERELPVLDPAHRMNDAKLDPAGRFWAGSTERSFAPGEGVLWRLDGAMDGAASWRAEPVLSGLTLPNGLDWSPDGRTFYLVDSLDRVVFAFAYDSETGALGPRRRLIELPDDPAAGLPDGLCVDREGCLWIACYDAARLARYSPAGELVRTVALPVTRPTSCAFVGPELDHLWITSARDGLSTPGELDGSHLLLNPYLP